MTITTTDARRLRRRAWLTAIAFPALGVLFLHAAAPAPCGPPEGQAPCDLPHAYYGPPESWPPANMADPGSYRELAALPLGPDPDDAGRIRARLGEDLFHAPELSARGDLACTACHQPAAAWGDERAAGSASDGGPIRNAPSVITSAHRSVWSWDGGSESLTAQVLAPLIDPEEMGNPDLAVVVRRLARHEDFSRRFREAYGAASPSADQLADSLVAFLATLEQPTRFDRFASGDPTALTDEEIWGLHLFRTTAGCANCHSGPLLSDEQFHNLGLSAFGEPSEDLGRYLVTGRPEDAGAFRTPSLRHVSRTAPYMHTGHFETLEGIVNFYARGGGEVWARNEAEARRPLYPFAARLSPHLTGFSLSEEEKRALVAFLRAL